MADEKRNANDAPDGFWDELGAWLTSDEGNREKVLNLFASRNDAPAPPEKEEEGKADEGTSQESAPKRGRWFR